MEQGSCAACDSMDIKLISCLHSCMQVGDAIHLVVADWGRTVLIILGSSDRPVLMVRMGTHVHIDWTEAINIAFAVWDMVS